MIRRLILLVKRLAFFANDAIGLLYYILRGRRPRPGLTVLCYHRVADGVDRLPPFEPYNVSPRRFAAQVQAISNTRGVEIARLDDVLHWLDEGFPEKRSYVLITFDDGWKNQLGAAKVLAGAGAHAVFFLSTAFIGAPLLEFSAFDRWIGSQPGDHSQICQPMDEGDCRRLIELGMAVQPHGHRHRSLGNIPSDEMLSDISESVRRTSNVTGTDAVAFAYPYGSSRLSDVTDAVTSALRDQGIRLGLTTDAGSNPPERLLAAPLLLRRIPVMQYDRGLLAQAKAAGYCGVLDGLKVVAHGLQRLAKPRGVPR